MEKIKKFRECYGSSGLPSVVHLGLILWHKKRDSGERHSCDASSSSSIAMLNTEYYYQTDFFLLIDVAL